MPALHDVWTQPVFTELVKRQIDEIANRNDGEYQRQHMGDKIAPLRTVRGRTSKLRVAGVQGIGLAQLKAPNATPALTKHKPTLEEKIIGLALIDEMERIDSEEWILLRSNDETVRDGTRLSLLERMAILQNRNERRTEWMRWEAFKGSLTLSYPEGGDVVIDYGFPAGHTPSAGTAWTDLVNSDPIADMDTWIEVGSADAGMLYTNFHMSFKTLRLMLRNEKVLAYLTSYGRELSLVTANDLPRLLAHGMGNFITTDAGYRTEGSTGYGLTKFLPDNRVLMTTDYVVDGMPIADVADGQVLVGGGGDTVPEIRQGMQSEFLSDHMSKNVFARQASARIPRIHRPECFLYANVS